jgi:undecaprenyl-diphosphatase
MSTSCAASTLAGMARTTNLLGRIDAADMHLCRWMNRSARSAAVRRLFRVASRLGDGVIWYTLIASLPLLYGERGIVPALQMALTGLAGLLLYRYLKRVFVRERPFITHAAITRVGVPLDRYSFPSGHTLHAVSFTTTAVAYFPELGWVLVPIASLIAMSRVVLGLHYPTDVLAGAAIGATLATLGLLLI